mmetsp:Transcript_8799/g.17976  ORF Transcript_8799/g.17976 Transcript_8799/m.17976 type:complete len:428 (+) Transcript_8799:341-1624(+)
MNSDDDPIDVAITNPHDHDLICGRGGRVNSHPGNRRFRNWVNERKERYTLAKDKSMKFSIAQEVIGLLRAQDPPGRVLKYDSRTDQYTEVNNKKAMAKTTQALREGAPELRKAKGILQIPHHPVTTKTKKGMSAAKKRSSGSDCRPTTVHIKLSGKAIADLHRDREQWQDADSEESSVEDDDASSSITHNIDDDDKSGTSQDSELQEVAHKVSYDSGDSGNSRKRDPNDIADLSNKKPKGTSTTASSGHGSSTPPAEGKADLLYALATTCAKHASSSTASPPVISQDMRPGHLVGDRLVTPEKGQKEASLNLSTLPSAGQLAILEKIRAGSGIPASATSFGYANLSSTRLTPSENVRLQKEKLVQAWLITSMPYLHTDDIRSYTRRLVDDGFDSLPMLTEQLEEDDLDFMKKGHKRALLKVIEASKK